MPLFAHSLSPFTHFSHQLSVTPERTYPLGPSPFLQSVPLPTIPPLSPALQLSWLRNVRAKCVDLTSLPACLPTSVQLKTTQAGSAGLHASAGANIGPVQTHADGSSRVRAAPSPQRIPYKDREAVKKERKKSAGFVPDFPFQLFLHRWSCFILSGRPAETFFETCIFLPIRLRRARSLFAKLHTCPSCDWMSPENLPDWTQLGEPVASTAKPQCLKKNLNI